MFMLSFLLFIALPRFYSLTELLVLGPRNFRRDSEVFSRHPCFDLVHRTPGFREVTRQPVSDVPLVRGSCPPLKSPSVWCLITVPNFSSPLSEIQPATEKMIQGPPPSLGSKSQPLHPPTLVPSN